MKKFFSVLIAAVCFVTLCAFGLTACDADENEVVEVESVTLDMTELTLTEGEDYTLIATITPSNATNQDMEWASSNDGVATVDSGSVFALSEGSATITVRTNNGKTASCAVTVEAAEEPPVQCTVTFYANGGEFDGGKDAYEMQVVIGEKITETVTVTRGDKYAFTNWYKDEYRTNLWDFDEDIVTGDANLYAGWKYLNKYQSVIDALEERIKTERQGAGAEVEILSVFTDSDGYLCFAEKDGTGAFSYKTGICGYDEVVGNAEIVSQIQNTTLTQLKDYNDYYTSDSDALIADSMAYRYTDAADVNDAIVYSCVSPMQLDTEGHFTTNGPWYCCKVKAIIVDADGKVFDCSFTVVSGTEYINAVISGTALSKEFDVIMTELGETANDFYLEYILAKHA
ncbi:MAG: Ig-like domain-containing protein [Clostridia bacterium]|nr:Ig-like domain-containing protein [Clostridia bacterium]